MDNQSAIIAIINSERERIIHSRMMRGRYEEGQRDNDLSLEGEILAGAGRVIRQLGKWQDTPAGDAIRHLLRT